MSPHLYLIQKKSTFHNYFVPIDSDRKKITTKKFPIIKICSVYDHFAKYFSSKTDINLIKFLWKILKKKKKL